MRKIDIRVEPIKHNDGTKSYRISTYYDGKKKEWQRVERHLILSKQYREAFRRMKIWIERVYYA